MTEEKKEAAVKECVKCKKEISQSVTKCPHCKSSQASGTTRMTIGCLLVIIIIVVAAAFIMPMCGTARPRPMVDTSAPIEVQRKQAKNLKREAYVISRKFITKQLKAPSLAAFEGPDMNMITWLKGNEFTCIMRVDYKNDLGLMLRSSFWTKIQYTGKDNWILLDIKQRK